jgi:pimeloyl-ACP methyl ester carboxylesterase
MFDIPTGLDRITCPVLIMQGTADPLIPAQSPRFLTFIPHAQFRWLYGLSHVPISDDPGLVTGLMLDFLRQDGPSSASGAMASGGYHEQPTRSV